MTPVDRDPHADAPIGDYRGIELVQWIAYLTAVATSGLLLVAIATLILAWDRFLRETLSISVTARYGGVSGEGYHEVGFEVCLLNKGTQDVVVYSGGYHVNDDLDNRNFRFHDQYIYHRPAAEDDAGAFPKLELKSGAYESYHPESPFQTTHSEIMFPIRIPAGGIYTGLWPVTIVRHRDHLAALQKRIFSDYAGLYASTENPTPFIFFSTIHGTKKVTLRPFGRWPRLVRLYRRTVHQVSRVPPLGVLKRLLFSPGSGSEYGYWADRQVRSERRRHRFNFPPRSIDRGIHPMSVEENEQKKSLPHALGLTNSHQVQKDIARIAKDGVHIETANHAFETTMSHGYRYGLLSATVERPTGYSTYKAHSFLELNMLLCLDESWAHPVVDTVCKRMADARCETYDTRYYLVPHYMD